MSVLHRKLRREIRGNLGALLSVVAITAVGVSDFIGLRTSQGILQSSQLAYYSAYRFADFWVDVKKAPLSAVEPIADLPGVAAIQPRIVFDVIVDLPGVVRPLTGRLISTPERGFEDTINGLHLIRGSGFSADRDEEVIVSESFAAARNLDPGDRIGLILNRKHESFVIVGTAISPEYVYMVRGTGDIVPDPDHFGVLYVKEKYARDALDFKNACNQIVGQMVPGSGEDIDLLLDRIDRMLDPYGVLAKTPRERQASHRFLSDEIQGLATFSLIVPTIFLSVAALVLNILMTRIAERQRTIIGTLKALGYSNVQVLSHFLTLGVGVGVLGGLGGWLIGLALTTGMIGMYAEFYKFPEYLIRPYPSILLFSLGVAVFFAIGGTAKGVWRVLRLSPSEAMRPAPPERGGAVLFERFTFIWRRLGFRTHMALRSLARHRGRTLTAIISSAAATAIILATLVLRDSMWFFIDFQFEYVAHSDVDIGMRDEASAQALLEASALPGVDLAEPMLGLVCDLRHGRSARRLSISGLTPGHRLTTPVQSGLRPVSIPPVGLVLSSKLAQILDVQVGDHLELTPIRGRRETVQVPVASIVDSYLGLECYADHAYLSSLVGEALAINALQTAINPAQQDSLYRSIKDLPNARGLSVRADSRRSLESTFIKSITFMLSVLITFAGTIAFGSVLNNSLVEIADRTRDISSLRVLGYEPRQISGIFFRQNLIVFLVGLALAGPLGYAMIIGVARAYDTELFRMVVVFKPTTILLAGAIAFVFVLLAQLEVHRQIRKLDWLEGIKIKE